MIVLTTSSVICALLNADSTPKRADSTKKEVKKVSKERPHESTNGAR